MHQWCFEGPLHGWSGSFEMWDAMYGLMSVEMDERDEMKSHCCDDEIDMRAIQSMSASSNKQFSVSSPSIIYTLRSAYCHYTMDNLFVTSHRAC